MSISSWLEKQAIRNAVSRIPFKEVQVPVWLLALIAGLIPLLGGIAPRMETDTLTVSALAAAISAGVLGALGKVMNPGAVLHSPRILKALTMAFAAAVPMLGAAIQDGTITPSEWSGIVAAFATVAWAKWSTPNKVTS